MRFTRLMMVLAAAMHVAAVQAQSSSWIRLERIDVRPDGTPAASMLIESASISDDGRWVIFASASNDIVAGDSNGVFDVFARDRLHNTTVRLSLRPGGLQTVGSNASVSASSDGRFVTFVSSDNGYVIGDANNRGDQFLLDRDVDADGVFDEISATSIERVSVNASGGELANGVRGVIGGVSDDGTSIAFATLHSIASNDTNGEIDVYVRDRNAGDTPVMSQSASGVIGNGESPDFFLPPLRISDSGAAVAFSSVANNLVPGDSGNAKDIVVRLRDTDGNGIFDEPGGVGVVLASTQPGGAPLQIGGFAQFDLSGDGRWMAISARDTAGPNPSGTDVVIRDIVADAIIPIAFVASTWAKGTSSCCGNQNPRISRGAEVVAFTSSQNYSINGASTGRGDVFVKPRDSELVRLTDYPIPTDTAPGYTSFVQALSANGAYLLVTTTNLGATPIPEQGISVYQRNRVFSGSFE